MCKQAMRMPWSRLVQTLREKHLLPDFIPTLPYLEPEEPEEPAELVAPEIIPVPITVPIAIPSEKKQEEMLAPEQRPKPKSEGEQASVELPQ